MKASDVLRKAGDVLRDRGWWNKGGYVDREDPKRPVCVYGALNIAREGNVHSWKSNEGVDEFDTVIGTRMGAQWNDQPARTVDEVLAAMDAAYVLALQEEGADLDEVFA